MQRRPHRNQRRGLLRAGLVVVGLIVLLLAILLVISSLTASTVKAPTVPSTPTPGKLGTPVTTPVKKKPGTPTKGKKKSVSMVSGRRLADGVLSTKRWLPAGATVAPNGHFVAFFRQVGNAYARSPLMVRDMRTGATRRVGYGDPLGRPVWSHQSTSLMYVRVSYTRRFPGAVWTLLQTNLQGRTDVLSTERGLNLQPLGWDGHRALYLVTTATDTSVFAVVAKRRSFLSILVPQVITSAALSPDGKSIGYTVPTGCGYCTANIFDLEALRTLYGPSGFSASWDLAWTADSHTLVTRGMHGLALVDRRTGSVRSVTNPTALPQQWPHSMRARVSGSHVELIDTATGVVYGTSTRA